MHRPGIAVVLPLLGVLAGCVTVTPPSSPAALPTGPLPPPHLTTSPVLECDRVALNGVIRSHPSDPRLIWLETSEGKRIEVVWPAGYRAEWKLAGDELYLEVYDARGRPFITTTDIPNPQHVCESGRPNTVLLMQTSS